MILYRFSHERYSDDLSGTGAKLYGGRWNSIGLPALYTSSNISLSLLEVLVNSTTLTQLKSLVLMRIEIPALLQQSVQTLPKLKGDWYYDIEYCKWIGTEFLKESNHLLLQCPSAVVHEEMNYLVNPMHKDFKKVKLLSGKGFVFDERLFKTTFN
ncbi:MAG: hypothetical protein JWQ96_2778 [Segetibacter sp.]|nr:hypothetical protein [Segetibacter sp.]